MKKIIGKVEYDTATAMPVAKYTEGTFGEPDGFEETLCQTQDGKFFLYVRGGADSPYPQENIKRMSKVKADEWKQSRNL